MLCLPIVLQLWSMNDRTVRTVMLSSLKQLCPSSMIPASAINKHIFDHMLAGFSDSSAKYVIHNLCLQNHKKDFYLLEHVKQR